MMEFFKKTVPVLFHMGPRPGSSTVASFQARNRLQRSFSTPSLGNRNQRRDDRGRASFSRRDSASGLAPWIPEWMMNLNKSYLPGRISRIYKAQNNQVDWDGVDQGSRLGALYGTAKFEEGTVGYGVHASIAGIYLPFGEFGAARIGDVFNSEEAQEILARESTSENHKAIAKIEYDYWAKVYNEPSSWGDLSGGFAGSSVKPDKRVIIQQRMEKLRAIMDS